MTIDLRSDTVTRPTAAMFEAMMKAQVGDDVYGEDPAINRLQEMAAAMFGKEAALFCPSGTMTNQIAIKMHTQPGDELICAENSHVYKYEGGGIAFNAGVQAKVIPGDRGRITASQIEAALNADDIHFPPSRLVCLENTSNRGGGSIYELQEMQHIKQLCERHHIALHLDGARVFNALAEKDYTAADLGNCFDSISICLSKGLGAPVGSLLLGSGEMIVKARRLRKIFGGGMRQAGFLAAAGIYALEHHIERLRDDHRKAKETAALLMEMRSVRSVMPADTNIVIFSMHPEKDADRLQEYLRSKDVLCGKVSGDSLRFVFHLDISEEQHTDICNALRNYED